MSILLGHAEAAIIMAQAFAREADDCEPGSIACQVAEMMARAYLSASADMTASILKSVTPGPSKP